nr:9881_t:CDS:2 [Entrophospora candida]
MLKSINLHEMVREIGNCNEISIIKPYQQQHQQNNVIINLPDISKKLDLQNLQRQKTMTTTTLTSPEIEDDDDDQQNFNNNDYHDRGIGELDEIDELDEEEIDDEIINNSSIILVNKKSATNNDDHINKRRLLLSSCLQHVFDYLKDADNDEKTLYSCLFLNRECLNLVVPLLWRNPFKSDTTLKRYSTTTTMTTQRIAINYAKYLQEFDNYLIENYVRSWLTSLSSNHNDLNFYKRFFIINQYLSKMLIKTAENLQILKISPDYNNYEDFTNNINNKSNANYSSHSYSNFATNYNNHLVDFSLTNGAKYSLSKVKTFSLDYHIENESTRTKVLNLLSMLSSSSSPHSSYVSGIEKVILKIRYYKEELIRPKIGMVDLVALLKLLNNCRKLKTLEFDGYFDPNKLLSVNNNINNIINNVDDNNGNYQFNFEKLIFMSDISSQNPFSSTRTYILSKLLKCANKKLKHLYLSGITQEILDVISEHNTELVTLHLKLIDLNNLTLKKILTSTSKTLKELFLGDTHFDLSYIESLNNNEKFIVELARSIPENVETLGINFWMDTKYVKLFLSNLSNLSNLRKIILCRNIMIKDEVLIEIKDFIKGQKELREKKEGEELLINLKKLYYLPEEWIRFNQKFIGFSQSEIEKAKEFIPIIKEFNQRI